MPTAAFTIDKIILSEYNARSIRAPSLFLSLSLSLPLISFSFTTVSFFLVLSSFLSLFSFSRSRSRFHCGGFDRFALNFYLAPPSPFPSPAFSPLSLLELAIHNSPLDKFNEHCRPWASFHRVIGFPGGVAGEIAATERGRPNLGVGPRGHIENLYPTAYPAASPILSILYDLFSGRYSPPTDILKNSTLSARVKSIGLAFRLSLSFFLSLNWFNRTNCEFPIIFSISWSISEEF